MIEASVSEKVKEGAMEWEACVGVDWADRKHAYAVRGADGSEETGEFLSRPEDVHEWARGLRDRYPTGTIVVALEQSRGALLYALSGYEYLRLVPINPRASKAYRSSLRLSGAKDDPSDAVLLRDFAAAHLDELRVWTPDDVPTRKLRLLVESRRSLVDQRTAFTLGLNEVLKQYYPQILEWFGRGASTLAREFVLRWTTLEQARGARADALRRLVQQLSRRSPVKIDELIVKIRAAVALTTDPAILEAHALRARSLIALIAETERQVSLFDAEIAELWSTHADRKIFESFPGAGPVMAPRLSAAFGSDRNRFADAIQMQNYSGIAPVTERSGKHCWVHSRWQCPKFLRQSFHEFAELSIPHSSWARAFYYEQRNRGAGHHEAIRSLAFRWIRILFQCWSTNTPYDESRYLNVLKARRSPLIDRIAA